MVIERGVDVLVVGLVVLPLDGEDWYLVVGNQRRRRVVLGGEGVGGGEDHLRPAGLERAGQAGRLSGDVEAGGETHARQWFFLGEALADEAQYRHLPLRPLDAQPARGGQVDIFDVVVSWHGNLLDCWFLLTPP